MFPDDLGFSFSWFARLRSLEGIVLNCVFVFVVVVSISTYTGYTHRGSNGKTYVTMKAIILTVPTQFQIS